MNEILICISGWGSRCAIFEPLLAGVPSLARRHRIELAWEDFVAITDRDERREALLQNLQKNMRAQLSPNWSQDWPHNEQEKLWETTNIVVLGWSLGSLLALELSLQLAKKYPLPPSNSLDKSQGNSRRKLLLLNPTAALCSGQGAIPPAALQIMQRQLRQTGNSVRRDFAAKLEANVLTTNNFYTDCKEFTKIYLQQAKTFSSSELHAGLEYLISCNLHTEVIALPYPALLVSGRDDTIIPAAQGEHLAQLLDRSQFAVVAGTHSPLLATPQLLEQFLQANK